jgi:protein-tyrosine phosphatase
MDAGAAAVLRERGLTPDSFRAQALTAAQIARADLVMTAEPAHRAAVARLDPTALRRAFTIPELGALASAAAASTDVLVDVATDVATGVAVGSAPGPTPAAQARAVVGRLAALRGTVLVPEGAAGMIPDPYGGSLGQFREVAELIDTALAPFVRLVVPSTSSGQGSAVGHGPHP